VKRTAQYYDTSVYAEDVLLRGTGVIGMISGDQLHPPMVDDADIWKNSARWKEGGAATVRRLLKNAGVSSNDLVLDVGCGIGGATRMLTREFDARALGLNISEEQMRTARKLGSESYIKGSADQIPVRSNAVDCVVSVNMFYHVAAHSAALREMNRVTRRNGKLAWDDWILTDHATELDRKELNQHWNPEPVRWITDAELQTQLLDAGYEIEQLTDLTGIGTGVMAEHFAPTFEREVRPLIEAHDAQYGSMIADHLKAAIDHTIHMYRQGKMRYLQIIARKP
jgi:cyclopropane fatty-acyl-phospholipid synthase-like methyltransferase